jgi:hypothetical protein
MRYIRFILDGQLPDRIQKTLHYTARLNVVAQLTQSTSCASVVVRDACPFLRGDAGSGRIHNFTWPTGEQPAREKRDCSQDVILELFYEHGLHNRDLVAGRCRMITRERTLGAGWGEEERRVVCGERIGASTVCEGE